MKIKFKNYKVFFENKGLKKEIYPFLPRGIVERKNFVDKGTQQRLFDSKKIEKNIEIKNLTKNYNFY